MGHYASEMMPPRKKEEWEKYFHQSVESYRLECKECGSIVRKSAWEKHWKCHREQSYRERK